MHIGFEISVPIKAELRVRRGYGNLWLWVREPNNGQEHLIHLSTYSEENVAYLERLAMAINELERSQDPVDESKAA